VVFARWNVNTQDTSPRYVPKFEDRETTLCNSESERSVTHLRVPRPTPTDVQVTWCQTISLTFTPYTLSGSFILAFPYTRSGSFAPTDDYEHYRGRLQETLDQLVRLDDYPGSLGGQRLHRGCGGLLGIR
jgi:hypothetical protein